ncbi:MAG: membrane protein insertase YidC [Hyphomicrobiaceae bacterium]|nr:membrane protein insertase YidC [Hyphomicrobiaceae bacterium]
MNDDNNNSNFMLAIVLSGLVLLVWQIFYMGPIQEKERLKREQAAEFAAGKKGVALPAAPGAVVGAPSVGAGKGAAGSAPVPAVQGAGGVPVVPGGVAPTQADRATVIARSPRYLIDTPSLSGSISLKGGRIDDLVLRKYRVKVDKDADKVVFFSPSGSENPLYAEYGWSAAPGSKLKLPNAQTLWKAQGTGTLTAGGSVVLTYDNGEGLNFKRTIQVDENYLFSISQSVTNTSGSAVSLHPYALISRHGMPKVEGFYILHEGLLGVLGEEGLQELDYDEILEEKSRTFRGKQGWLGLTDKYWAAALIPEQSAPYEAHFSGSGQDKSARFQTDYLLNAVNIPVGSTKEVRGHLFAGAKKVDIIDHYGEKYGIKQLDLLIDWGWFPFITKPMFMALHFFFGLFGNFGVAILLVTVLVKILFFPLANKSYESMSKMKKLQPEMQKIRERYADDKMKQQQETMALYQKSGANPLSGCLPVVIQIPVFFALYKVLFVTLEMRHAPFFGWIHDLSAPDPTSLFNLFGLLPFGLPEWASIGVWPVLMGITMWVQMKLNPQQGDPTQAMIFNWMPVLFTFMLASFPAGLVIYWAWNNFLSVLQQWYIMNKNGVEVDLLENTGIRKLMGKVSEKAGGS